MYDLLSYNNKINNPKKLTPYFHDTYKMKHGKGELSQLRIGGLEGTITYIPINKVAVIEKLRKHAYLKGEEQLEKIKKIIEEWKNDLYFLNDEKDLIGEDDIVNSLCNETKFMGTDFVPKRVAEEK